jgi:hypothetical protein
MPNIIPIAMAEISFDKDLRWLLVGMLFALVIGEIASQTGRLVTAVKISKPFKMNKAGDFWAIVAHLILVTTVVTTSWVGWSMSLKSDAQHLQWIFSWPFVLLLIDLAILVCYFLMVGAVTAPKADWVFVASAREDSFLLLVIFLGYFFWGIVNQLCLNSGWDQLWTHAWPTLAGCFIMLAIWLLVRKRQTAKSAIIADIVMLATVLAYRYVKAKLAFAT